jgi:hypothetical protein
MKKKVIGCMSPVVFFVFSLQAFSWGFTKISPTELKAGGVLTIEGSIPPQQDLYVTIASRRTFAPLDTTGPHELKRFKRDAEKFGFTPMSRVPVFYYIITNRPDKFGHKVKKKFGGPSFLGGIYSTSMFQLAGFMKLDKEAKRVLGPVKREDQWNLLKYLHETPFGINTVVKEGSKRGKIVIFARSVLTDHLKSGNYWDAGTSVKLDKETGRFTVTFTTFRHTPPDTAFDVYINGWKVTTFTVKANGFWLHRGYRYINPLWIILGASLVAIFFTLIGAAGGMLMAAFQVMVVNTAGPIGINAANVLRSSNVALTLFAPLGSFYRYAFVEKRVAWPVGISFGVGIFIGSIWLGRYVVQYLPMRAYIGGDHGDKDIIPNYA